MPVILLAALFSVVPSATWLDVPAEGQAPAFRLRVTASGARLTLELEGAAKAEARATGLHVWLADSALVRRREEDLATAKRALAEVQALEKDPEHQAPDCRERMSAFVRLASARVAALGEEELFAQVLVRFPGAEAPPAGITGALFTARGTLWTAELDLDGALALAGPEVRALSLGARLEPLAAAKPGPIATVLSAKLPAPLRLTLEPDVGLDRLVTREPAFVLRPTAKGYRTFFRPDVGELGCFGVEGTFHVPGAWAEPEILRRTLAGGARLRLYGTHLAIERGGKQAALPLELSSPAAQELDVVDFQPVPKGFVLVFTTGGPSRPGGGMGMCGAGTERDLVWLQLRDELSVVRHQVVPLESCFTSVVPEPIDGGWQLSDYGKKRRSEVRYDPRQPLAGIGVTHSPRPE